MRSADRGQREHRAQQRSGQPSQQAERGQVAEQDVLRHVEREQLLLADRRER